MAVVAGDAVAGDAAVGDAVMADAIAECNKIIAATMTGSRMWNAS